MVHGKPKHKRRTQYFTHKQFQLRYLSSIFVIVIILIGVASSTVYFSVFDMLSDKLGDVYPQNELQPIMRAVNGKLIRNLILLIPVILIGAVYLSHKIAGPLYRIEESIKSMTQGNYRINVQLRKYDEFQDLAKSLNLLLEHLQKRSTLIRQVSDELGQYLAKQDSDGGQDYSVLKNLKAEIDKTLLS